MPQFAQKIIRVLADTPAPQDIMDSVVAAADCLAKVHVGNFTSGIFPEIDEEGVTLAEAKQIEAALLSIYHGHPRAEGISTVIWALTKTSNPDHRPLFLRHAEWSMGQMMYAYANLSQAVRALEDFSRPVEILDYRSSLMAAMVDLGDAYLREEGIFIPVG